MVNFLQNYYQCRPFSKVAGVPVGLELASWESFVTISLSAESDVLTFPADLGIVVNPSSERSRWEWESKPRTGIDVFDQLRRDVLESLRWRQRLPAIGAVAPFSEEELR